MDTYQKDSKMSSHHRFTGMLQSAILILVLILAYSAVWAAESESTTATSTPASKNVGFDTDIAVCMIDVTVGSQSVTGNTEPLAASDNIQKEMYVDGRVAFYVKGKIKGKYLLTMQMDTGEGPVEKMFTNLDRKVFDRIDPDKYYPVYGDQSTVVNDTESQGKVYVRLEWDNSKVLWGNYQVALNQTDLTKYNRSLYGLDMQFLKADPSAKAVRQGTEIFWAEPQTLHSRDELRSTGGSLYYLKHGDILIGSEQLQVEVRDSISGQVIHTFSLVYGTDYTLDDLQGRLMLKRDLKSVVSSGLITVDQPLDDNTIFLIADYEFDASQDVVHNSSYGLRSSYFLADSFRVGGSYLKENIDNGNDYRLYGMDYQWKISPDLVFDGEYAQSESSPSNRFYSNDGGLTYTDYLITGELQTANAWKAGLKANLSPNLNLKLSYQVQEKNFANGGNQALNDTYNYGLELGGQIFQNQSLLLKYDYYNEADTETKSTSILQLMQPLHKFTWTEELRMQTYETNINDNYRDTLGAVRLDYKASDNVTLFGSHQSTLSRNDVTPANNRNSIGAGIDLNNKTHLDLETSQGDLGDYSRLGLNYQYTEDRRVYGESRYDTDMDGGKTFLNKVGNSAKLNNNIDFYTERQIANGTYEDSTSNLYGFTYTPSSKWSFNLDYTKSTVDKLAIRPIFDYPYFPTFPDPNDTGSLGLVDRNTLGIGILYTAKTLEYKTRVQIRRDEGTEELRQYVTTNAFKWAISDEVAFSAGWKYSFTKDLTTTEEMARYVESTLGLAYRPVKLDRLNLLWEYTYLEEFSPQTQVDGTLPGERSRVFSLDANYDLTKRWQVGEKWASKRSEIWVDANDWEHNQVYLWVNRLTYSLVKQWDLYGEYRTLWNDLADDRKNGFLFAVYYNVTQNAKFGVGYNFTDFNDNLTHLDYNVGGWFANIIMKW